MSDSVERLYLAVIAARDLDPERSRTARLFHRGPAKMAKKLAEEAIEVVIDAVNGKPDAVVRESADLLYNLTVFWASAGVRPDDVWREMERREQMLGIAEKLPKAADKVPRPRPVARRDHCRKALRPKVAGPPRSGDELSRWKAARSASAVMPPEFPRLPAWTNPSLMVHRSHAETDLNWCIDAAHKPHALWILGAVAFAESSFPGAPRHHAAADVAGAARGARLLTVCTLASVAGGLVGYAIGALLYSHRSGCG